MASETAEMSAHHNTRTIAYPLCPSSHVVEYYHAPHNCHRSDFIQSNTCVNTSLPTDNPQQLQATHYRMTTSSKDDSKPMNEPNRECPVCEREELERVWREGFDVKPEVKSESEVYGGSGRLKSGLRAEETRRESEVREKLWREMPYAEVWVLEVDELGDEDWVDQRPYKNMLAEAWKSRRGVNWPMGGYRGLNHIEGGKKRG